MDTKHVKRQSTRLYYGWIIVAAATLMYTIVGGQSVCIGIFIKPVATAFDWSRASVTTGYSIYTLAISFFGIASGFLCDRYGARIVIFLGSISLGLGFVLCSFTTSLWLFYLGFGLLRGIGFIFIYIPLSVTIANWFTDKKGLALGLLFSGGGVGGLILAPLIQFWLSHYGWRTAFVITGALIFCISLPLNLLIKKNPGEMGLQPSGKKRCHGKPDSDTLDEERVYTASEAMRSSSFWIFCLAVLLIWLGILMAQINLVPYATDIGFSAGISAFVLGISSGFNAFGRLSIGVVSDKIGTKRAVGFSLILGSLMLFWLIFISNNWMLYLFAGCFGLAYGGFIPQQPRIIVELFGRKSMGSIMGLSNIFIALGPALGPVAGAAVYDYTGSYTYAFIMGGTSILAGLLLILLLKLPSIQRARSHIK